MDEPGKTDAKVPKKLDRRTPVTFFLVLSLLVAVYIVLGGLLFQYIERKPEDLNAPPKVVVEQKLGENGCLDQQNLNRFLNNLISQLVPSSDWSLNLTFLDEIIGANSINKSKELVLLATVSFRENDKWDLYGSIFFAETLITTIGYGQVTPASMAGRIVACVYSIIGIPLLGLWATAIGENIICAANKLRKSIAIKKKWHRQLLILEVIVVTFVGSGVFIFAPAILFSQMESWTYADSVYCIIMAIVVGTTFSLLLLLYYYIVSIVTLATVGLGDFVAGYKIDAPGWYRAFLHFWLLFGLGWLSMIISLAVSIFRTRGAKVVKKAEEKMVQITNEIKQKLVANKPPLERRNSFSGKRQVSVMFSHTPASADMTTTVNLMDLSFGMARLISGIGSIGDNIGRSGEQGQTSQLQQSLRQFSFGARSPGISPLSSFEERSRSRKGSVVSTQSDAMFTHPLPTISESGVTEESDGPRFAMRKPSLVVQTSKRRPSLSARTSSILLMFDRNKVSDAMAVNNAVLEQLALDSIGEEAAAPSQPQSMRRGSLAHPPSWGGWNRKGRANSVFDNGIPHLRHNLNGADNLVVVTDNGIAESLCSEITVLRPRSRSADS